LSPRPVDMAPRGRSGSRRRGVGSPVVRSGSASLFGREHLVNFEEDFATVIRRIQTGPYIRTDHCPCRKLNRADN